MKLLLAKLVLVAILLAGTAETLVAQPLVYAPLPLENLSRTQASNQPFVDLLAELLDQPVEMRLFESHEDLLNAFGTGEIDLVMLGSLPLLLAMERGLALQQVVMFRESNGTAAYRCVLAAPIDGVASLDELGLLLESASLALTREESTCGPVASFSILIDHGLSPDDFSSSYLGGHDDVARAVLLQSDLIGGLKESVAKKWFGLGLRVLAKSRQVPGLFLSARSGSLTSGQLDRLRAGLLELDPSRLESLQTGRYGFAEIDESLLLRVRAMRREAQPFIEQQLP
ncbi:MAG: PhnD/SsuA/transferrin family substrate-binding protein [Wenzhouxiangella sp.]|jgi:phosphonate transport system substrate-binding protein|nr:PhnD/SsuA/transferrin family substrate-binding protein [Wenzhouxiangella sp.]